MPGRIARTAHSMGHRHIAVECYQAAFHKPQYTACLFWFSDWWEAVGATHKTKR